jgi:CRISPR-associated protein Cmr2
MPDAVFAFTFGPVQGFISEARRTSDLFVGSRILVELAKAAGEAIQECGELVFPSTLGADVPNVLLAVIPGSEIEQTAKRAHQALTNKWHSIAQTARAKLGTFHPVPDGLWQQIWDRQVENAWETYWAASSAQGYRAAYQETRRSLDATKRTRTFLPAEESGIKDSLSGSRSALRTAAMDARHYWTQVSSQVTAAKLRPDGRERLDAIGAIKRFSDLAEQEDFPSTSTVASQPFLEKTRPHLADYRSAVESLLKPLNKPRPNDPDWPYDGDLLYMETLAPGRLLSSYGVQSPHQQRLKDARQALQELYRQVDDRPSPYYAVIALDGDRMGERISDCLNKGNPRQEHRELSRKLTSFAAQVPSLVDARNARVIYNGGDDVLALAPLSTGFELARQLALTFQSTTDGSASAGLAVVHHLYPLGAALRAARAGEKQAKQITGKAAVCVHVLRRSGEAIQMRSPWNAVDDTFSEVVRLFQEDSTGSAVSSRLGYDVRQAGYGLVQADEKAKAELKRLISRHRNEKHPHVPSAEQLAQRLCQWAQFLPARMSKSGDLLSSMEELGQWLVFARFVAQGGRE